MTCLLCSANAHAQIHHFAPACTVANRMERNKTSTRGVNLERSFVASVHAQLLICSTLIHTWAYHMEKISRRLLYIYRNWYYLWIELSGWMGSVSYGLGADLSLPPCLSVTIGIWTSLTKATSGPKSRGASFGTTLWRHVQRYCCLGI